MTHYYPTEFSLRPVTSMDVKLSYCMNSGDSLDVTCTVQQCLSVAS